MEWPHICFYPRHYWSHRQCLDLRSCADRLIRGTVSADPRSHCPEGPRCHALPGCDVPSNADSCCMLCVPVLDGAECRSQPLHAIDGHLTPAGGRARHSLDSRPVECRPLAICSTPGSSLIPWTLVWRSPTHCPAGPGTFPPRDRRNPLPNCRSPCPAICPKTALAKGSPSNLRIRQPSPSTAESLSASVTCVTGRATA
jgi:hypothetical protein